MVREAELRQGHYAKRQLAEVALKKGGNPALKQEGKMVPVRGLGPRTVSLQRSRSTVGARRAERGEGRRSACPHLGKLHPAISPDGPW